MSESGTPEAAWPEELIDATAKDLALGRALFRSPRSGATEFLHSEYRDVVQEVLDAAVAWRALDTKRRRNVHDNRHMIMYASLTRAEAVMLHPWIVHPIDALLRVTRLRDRLRCPCCGAVGTFKPHGTYFDREDLRDVPRWLCKWCGYYFGPEGSSVAFLHADMRVWMLPDTDAEGTTPEATWKRTALGWAWPWKG